MKTCKVSFVSFSTVFILGYCWDQSAYERAKLMKGHSKLFANRISRIPKDQDVWKY